ncbi:hypothetical protein MT996_08695 [Ornithobacterium rhinotracheale]|uniref:hypothetical protein n=1 Tax=Ornithobacterium rhinotracheale TaxID=28251 RepID=UPI00129CEC95|nr:hypothetical protein [Ornithobacterium rhinotracheale]UOH77284.1 hypothetical protein MT996_08695 [Ornithobacterium rhinotracheale]
MISLKDINYPESLKYSYNKTEKPYEFYCEAFSKSNEVKFLLGYFSSNALQSLIPSFCQFLVNSGKMTFVMNHVVSRLDYEELFKSKKSGQEVDIFKNVKELQKQMSKDQKFFFMYVVKLKFTEANIVNN